VTSTRDDSFHEIQLNGKQLVFLFMVAIVVSSVIFLCGVLVGRGVRTGRTELAEARAVEDASRGDVAPGARPAPAASADSDPRSAAPPPAVSDLSSFDRLERANPSADASKSDGPAPDRRQAAKDKDAAKSKDSKPVEAPPKQAAEQPKPAPSSSADPAPAASKADAAAPASAFVVQVAAMNVRSDAEARAKRLAAKGYSAYVEAPTPASPNVYRVRIGPFKSQREAQTTAERLQKEENVKQPWVTR
jgi:cell division septation protein DedD